MEKHATQALAWIAAQRRKEKRRDRADMKKEGPAHRPDAFVTAEPRSNLRSLRGRRCLRSGRADRRELISGHRLLRQQQAGTLVEIGPARPQHFGCPVEGFHHNLAYCDVDLAFGRL